MQIIPADPTHAAAISALIRSFDQDVALQADRAGTKPYVESTSADAEAGYIASPRYTYRVALDGAELLGVAALRDGTHVFHMFVARHRQRAGVGRALWEAVVSAAETNAAAARFTVNATPSALPFYEHLGFRPTGTLVEAHGIGCIPMERPAGPVAPTEKAKMLAGELYEANDAKLVAERLRTRALCNELNTLAVDASAERTGVLRALFAASPHLPYVTPPFFCDYGANIELGRNVYFNFNCVILDVCRVTIGDDTMFGPAVQIYTASHPLDAVARRSGREFGKPVAIGHDVWVGGGAIVCPGVEIGSGSVIGAGSVVTRDIPPGVFAAGNPCRVLRTLPADGDAATPEQVIATTSSARQ